MKIIWKRMLLLICFAVLIVSLSSGQVYAAKKTKIYFAHFYTDSMVGFFQEKIDEFQKKNKDIKVEIINYSYESFQNKFIKEAVSGQGPDLIIGINDWIGQFTPKGLIEPLNKYMGKKQLDEYIPVTVDSLRYSGKIYGLPLNYESVALLYNTNIVKSPPRNTKELIAVAKANTGKGMYGIVSDPKNFYYSACWFTGYGAKLFDKDGRPKVDSPESIKAARFIAELCYKQKVMPRETNIEVARELFNEGKAAMMITGNWSLTEKLNIPFKVTRIPLISETGKWPGPFVGVKALMINRYSKNKKAAFKLAKFLTSKEVQTDLAKTIGYMPANRLAYDDPKVRSNKIINSFREQVEVGFSMPNNPEMTSLWGPMNEALGYILEARKTPDAALKEAQNKINTMIEERKN